MQPNPNPNPNLPKPPDAALLDSFRDRRTLVVGLGRFGGGVGVTRWLADQGAAVTVTDRADPATLSESIHAVEGIDRISLHLGEHESVDLEGIDLAVINPAVHKQTSPLFQAITERKIPWTTELNLFCHRCPARVVGITGSYGKSTTAAMLFGVLQDHRRRGGNSAARVHLGGNIGGSLLADLNDMSDKDLVILELSNAQLEDLPRIQWAPSIAVIVNIAPHHLDRYDTYTDYIHAKLNIVGHPAQTQHIISGPLDQPSLACATVLLSDRYESWHRVSPASPPIKLRVLGRHNQENAACVLAIARVIGVDTAQARTELERFAGLPHRLEHVRILDGVDYYNDSKSTAPSATVAASTALERPTVLIFGGKDNGQNISKYASELLQQSRALIGVGESGPRFVEAINHTLEGTEKILTCVVSGLAEAVDQAKRWARPGEAILFSPGAPSFDAYVNFEQRGRHFVDIVKNLPPNEATGKN